MTIEVPDRYLHSPLAHVFVSNQVPVNAGTRVPVPFNSSRINEGGCFRFSPTPSFIAPEAGRYLVTISTGFESTSTSPGFGAFPVEVKSPTGVITQTLRPAGLALFIPSSNAGQFCGAGGSAVVQLELNGFLEFYCFTTVNVRFFGSNPTGEYDYVQVFKLP